MKQRKCQYYYHLMADHWLTLLCWKPLAELIQKGPGFPDEQLLNRHSVSMKWATKSASPGHINRKMSPRLFKGTMEIQTWQNTYDNKVYQVNYRYMDSLIESDYDSFLMVTIMQILHQVTGNIESNELCNNPIHCAAQVAKMLYSVQHTKYSICSTFSFQFAHTSPPAFRLCRSKHIQHYKLLYRCLCVVFGSGVWARRRGEAVHWNPDWLKNISLPPTWFSFGIIFSKGSHSDSSQAPVVLINWKEVRTSDSALYNAVTLLTVSVFKCSLEKRGEGLKL